MGVLKAFGRAVTTVAVMTCIAACSRGDHPREVEAGPQPGLTVFPSSTPAATAVDASADPAEACDGNKDWFGSFAKAKSPAENKAVFVARWKLRSVECRSQAMQKECARMGCDDLVSSLLISSASSPDEGRDLVNVRLSGNTAAVERVRPFYARVRPFAASPRTANRVATAGLKEEVRRALPTVPFGSLFLIGTLDDIDMCTGGDAEECAIAAEDWKNATDNLAKYDGYIARDRKVVAAGR